MPMGKPYDVCVIGGGPAGSAVALRLAVLGHAVCLVERQAFPRPHVGNSFAPGLLPHLEVLGVRERIEGAGFLRPHGRVVRWGEADPKFRSQGDEPDLLVDRARFDALLLGACRDAGVEVVQPAEALAPRRAGNGWEVVARSLGGEVWLGARFLIDATGRRALMPGLKRRVSAPALALCGSWRGTPLPRDRSWVEAGPDEWFWAAPHPDGSVSAMVFLDPKRCAGLGRGRLEPLYRALLASAGLLACCLRGTLAGPVTACNAASYLDSDPCASDHLKTGEACFAIDPLSSQGVQASIVSALQASLTAHTVLTSPAHTGAAVRFYRDRQEESVGHYQRLARSFYAEPLARYGGAFWSARAGGADTSESAEPGPRPGPLASLDLRLRVSSLLLRDETPAVVGGLIKCVPALTHPRLARPVVYVGGASVVPLVDAVVPGQTVGETLARWGPSHAPAFRWELFQWMWSHGIVEPYEH